MEKYVTQIITIIVAAALVGLVAYLVNSIKTDISELRKYIGKMVLKEVCDARREKMATDINNIGRVARGE